MNFNKGISMDLILKEFLRNYSDPKYTIRSLCLQIILDWNVIKDESLEEFSKKDYLKVILHLWRQSGFVVLRDRAKSEIIMTLVELLLFIKDHSLDGYKLYSPGVLEIQDWIDLTGMAAILSDDVERDRILKSLFKEISKEKKNIDEADSYPKK